MRKLTPKQRAALYDIENLGSLSRSDSSKNYKATSDREHHSNVIVSLINRGLIEATEANRHGTPLTVIIKKTN